MSTGNGGSQGGGQGSIGGQPQTPPLPGQGQPQLNIMAQYIKDFSFENPNSPRSLQPQQQPQINVQVAVHGNPLTETDVEVVLKIEGKAEIPGTLLFSFELSYAGIFRIQNVPPNVAHQVIMIECPRLLFPFAREIISVAVSNGGFPPLLLDPVDFAGLYQQNLAQAQAQAGNPPPANQA